MKAGIDIFCDGKSITDTVSSLGGGTIRIDKVPTFSAIEIATTYADQNVLTNGDRALYSTVGKASQPVTVTLIGSRSFIDEATRKINEIVFRTEAQKLVFGDEVNWYYMARVNASFVPEVDMSGSSPIATGTITFTFDDSKAYSTALREISLGENSYLGKIEKVDAGHYVATIDNQNEEADLEITIKTPSENGYLGLTNGRQVLQMGDINGADKKLYTIVDVHTKEALKNAFDSGTKNKGINVANNESVFTGSMAISSLWDRDHLVQTDRGRTSLTIDLSDDTGTKSELLWWRQIFWAGRTNQQGSVKILTTDQNGKLLYGAETIKNFGSFSTAYHYITGNADGSYNIVKTRWFNPTHADNQNPFNQNRGWSDIQREEDRIGFYWFGSREYFTRPELSGRRATKLHIIFETYGNAEKVTHVYMDEFKFRRTDSSKLSEVTNLFDADTTVKLNSADHQTFINGQKNVRNNARGSRPPKLLKGKNTLDIELSDWITKEPEITLRYRERRY